MRGSRVRWKVEKMKGSQKEGNVGGFCREVGVKKKKMGSSLGKGCRRKKEKQERKKKQKKEEEEEEEAEKRKRVATMFHMSGGDDDSDGVTGA